MIYNGSKAVVEQRLKFVMEHIEDEDGDDFLKAWETVWRDLIFQ